jgi:FlaG/FlaF family flagellin (archaellin)
MKYLFLPIVVLFILATSLTYSQVNYQTGNFAAVAGTSGYTLDKGTGDRIFVIEIKFDKPFTTKPDIQLNVNMVEGDKTGDLKYDVQTSFITNEGFTIKIKTWGEGKLKAIGGSWFAITK